MNPQIKEYRLMYLWGAWITDTRIYAESDEEAIHDSDEVFNGKDSLKNWKIGVALVQGDRFVKRYI